MKTSKKHIKMLLSALCFAFLIALLLAFSVPSESSSAASDEKLAEPNVKLSAAEEITLIPGNAYMIVFSSDANQYDAEISKNIRLALSGCGQSVRMISDAAQKPTDYEILIGNTNRPLSTELATACKNAVSKDSLVWGFAFKDGKFAYAASSDEAFARGSQDLFDNYIKDTKFVIPDENLWVIISLSRAEYEAEIKAEQDRIEAEKEAARQKRIEEMIAAIEAFTFADFSDRVDLDYTVMAQSTAWGKPQLYPSAGEHPRLNVTARHLEDIKEYLATDEGEFLYTKLVNLANTEFTGILEPAKEHTSGRRGFHNWNAKDVAIIEARAFLYLLTGDIEWGYNAILSMKNYFKTFEIGWIHSDQCREFGQIIFVGAEVYDWCYDLMSENDRNQFMIAFTDICSGSAKGTPYEGKCQSGNAWIEVGYPPSGQGSVSGHGSEHQILRDYLAVSVAIYDENPSWYNYVAARTYNDYIAVRNYYFQSGTYQQGIANYAPFRHNADLWSAWIFECATGVNPYIPALEQIAVSFYEYQLPDNSFFVTGDGSRHTKPQGQMVSDAMFVSGLYGNSAMRRAVIDQYSANFSGYSGTNIGTSFVNLIYLSASYYKKDGVQNPDPVHTDELPIAYHSYPIGQIIARRNWYNESSPAVFMKVGIRTTANHEHADAGSFQIFYKGLYSGESGVYDTYGSQHFSYYHQATVAHNSLLVFNPDLADSALDGSSVESSTNAGRVFYSGGQRRPGETSSLDTWLGGDQFKTGLLTGVQYGFKKDGSADYAYLAGDISSSYTAIQASYIGRNMFTLFTDNESYPMFFFVYDRITSADDNFVKKFLLHTPTEPVIDESAKTVTLTNKDGRLVLHSLKGGDKFEALGGEGKNYLINGVQCALAATGNDGMWGRVEISTTGTVKSEFLNLIYVTDATNDEKLSAVTIDTEHAAGVQVDSSVVIFTKAETGGNTEELKFTTEGKGLQRYFVLGMYPGTWDISVDGIKAAHAYASEDGAMISFYAPAGEVTVTPGKDIAPSNGGRIVYSTGGATIPADAPKVYEIGVPVSLPQTAVRGDDIFLGWYTSPTYDESTKITQINASEKGTFTVYAKFKAVPVLDDFEDKDFSISGANKTAGQLTYMTASKEGSVFSVGKDEASGNKYLVISRADKDLEIYANQRIGDYLGTFTSITFEMDLALNGNKQPIGSGLRLRENTNKKIVTFLNTGSDGSVTLLGGAKLFYLKEEFQKVIITIDFKESKIIAYETDGTEIAKTGFSVPETASAANTLEWAHQLTCTFNWWIGSGGESFLLDNMKIYCGSYEAPEASAPVGAKITYNTNGGALPSGYPKRYQDGVETTLPIPTSSGVEFAGWYTTPNFEKGTEISVLKKEKAEDITVYAKWTGTVYENNFNDQEFDYSDASDHKVSGVEYQLNTKVGSYVKTAKDGSGNTYVIAYTDENDMSINNFTKLYGLSGACNGKFTFTIDLATHPDGRSGYSNFRLRGKGSWTDTISLFYTSGGTVRLGGEKGPEIASLTASLQKIIITLDVNAESITAYSVQGTELASVKVTAPSGSVAEWVDANNYLFNWSIGKGGGIAFDNIKVFLGEYIPA